MDGPHDHYIRYVCERTENAVALLRPIVPAGLSQLLDWGSLALERSTFINPALRGTEGDMVFSLRMLEASQQAFLIFEHQSSVDRLMAERLRRYEARLLDSWRREHGEQARLPLIVCVVLYHGPPAWSAPRRYEELLGFSLERARREGWLQHLSYPEYVLEDLTRRVEQELLAWLGPALVRLALVLLWAGRTGELNRKLLHWVPLFQQVYNAPHGPQDLEASVTYVSELGNEATDAVMQQVLYSLMPQRQVEEMMLSLAQRMRAEGEARGEAKGRSVERAEAVLKVLAARGVPVDAATRERILGCKDLDTLGRWLDRALRANSLAQVLDEPHA